jgi:hypothetical protein
MSSFDWQLLFPVGRCSGPLSPSLDILRFSRRFCDISFNTKPALSQFSLNFAFIPCTICPPIINCFLDLMAYSVPRYQYPFFAFSLRIREKCSEFDHLTVQLRSNPLKFLFCCLVVLRQHVLKEI